jgi:signal transduction histidine kinase/CheY-like chemotaxis protein
LYYTGLHTDMNYLISFYKFFSGNGRNLYYDTPHAKLVVNLNTVWLVTYLNLVISNICIFIFLPDAGNYYYLLTLVTHILFWVAFFLTRLGGFVIARHVFLIVTYGMLYSYDHYLGGASLTSLYYIAFLPTAFKIFPSKKYWTVIIAYAIIPLLLLLLSNLVTYNMVVFPVQQTHVVLQVRIMNIILAFAMAINYVVYNVILGAAAQRKLYKQGVNLQTTLNNAVGAIWSIDKHYKITAVNESFKIFVEKVFKRAGLKIGVNIKDIVFSDIVPRYMQQHYIDALNGKEVFEEVSFDSRYYEVKAVPVYGLNGEIIGATFSSRDITRRKKTDVELREATMAKTRFLSNMSHEIRTPLNGIVGISGILLDEEYLPSQHENLQVLNNLSQHTLQLINNILDLSKIDAGKAEVDNARFNLQLLLNKLYSIFDKTARLKKIDFSIAVNGSADIYVKGDEVKLSQVLINLLGNAIKFTEKGFVTLKVDVAQDDTHYNLRFKVADSGIGIKKEDQQKIFESFTQADHDTTRKFGGTGLGITISEKILELMQSRLQLQSESGKGAEFWFDIKLAKSSIEPVKKRGAAATIDYALPGIKILVAEDNPVNQMVAKRFLQKWQASVIVTENGKEALYAASRDTYDLILMDLDMPVMDGYESAAAIKKINPTVPIVALTAAAFDDMHNYLSKKGFNEVVQKPFMPDDLYRKIASLIQKS